MHKNLVIFFFLRFSFTYIFFGMEIMNEIINCLYRYIQLNTQNTTGLEDVFATTRSLE